MKKLLASLLYLVLTLGVIGFYGCDVLNQIYNNINLNNNQNSVENISDETDENEYVELNREQVALFVNEMGDKDVETDFNKISCEAEVVISSRYNGMSADIEMNYKQIIIDDWDDIQIEGEMKIFTQEKSSTTTIKGDFYFTNGYVYENLDYDGTKMKVKMAINVDDYMSSYISKSPIVGKSLKELFEFFDTEMANGNGKIQVYINSEESNTKCKIKISDMVIRCVALDASASYDARVNGTYVLLYDENYKLISFNCNEQNVVVDKGIENSICLTAKLYEGILSFPSDLYTYQTITTSVL